MALAVSILEKILLQSKQAVVNVQGIINELRRDNIAIVINLDTGNTGLNNLNLETLTGGQVRSLTVLEIGGGLKIQTSLSDLFTVYHGDRIENEEIELISWTGTGAGTAVLRLTGLRL